MFMVELLGKIIYLYNDLLFEIIVWNFCRTFYTCEFWELLFQHVVWKIQSSLSPAIKGRESKVIKQYVNKDRESKFRAKCWSSFSLSSPFLQKHSAVNMHKTFSIYKMDNYYYLNHRNMSNKYINIISLNFK